MRDVFVMLQYGNELAHVWLACSHGADDSFKSIQSVHRQMLGISKISTENIQHKKTNQFACEGKRVTSDSFVLWKA